MHTSPLAFHAGLITVVALVPLMFAERARHRGLKLALKPLASAGFLLAAWQHRAFDSAVGQALFVGLCLSFVGDVALIFRARAAFLAGLSAFLLGHVGYAAAALIAGVDPAWAAVTALLLVPFSGLVYADLRATLPAGLVKPVVAYMVVITGMVITAVGAVPGSPAGALFAVGAFLFYLSDISVALDRFGGAGFGNRAIGLPLYYVAQLLIATTALGFAP